MKLLSLGTRIAAIRVVCLVGSAGVTSIPDVNYEEGRKSSLRATVIMADGTARTITLRGVGCPTSMCSRVRASDIQSDSLWLDGLASVREISHDADGPVKVTFRFKDGAERQASIVEANRVLYVAGRLGLTEKLDLGSVSKINFE
jgi:hypothetical protein